MILTETYELEDIYKYVTDFTAWTGNTPKYSDFILPDNHELIFQFKTDNPNTQIACSDLSDGWIYAQNFIWNSSKTMSYMGSNCITNTKNVPDIVGNKNNIYKIRYENGTFYLYQNDVLLTSQSTYECRCSEKHVRAYNNPGNLAYLKVIEL